MKASSMELMDARRFGTLHTALGETIQALLSNFDAISTDRKTLLVQVADYIADRRAQGRSAKLLFICTHNSRRSHLGQIWAHLASWLYGLDHVETYSGGTETTAFHFNALHALASCGVRVEAGDNTRSAHHFISFSTNAPRVEAWSKTFDDEQNPRRAFAAMMTCSDADEACPIIPGADARFPIRYDDPKDFDGTATEAKAYTERCRQIGTEMLYMMGNAASIGGKGALKDSKIPK
jgi:arsenate reductase